MDTVRQHRTDGSEGPRGLVWALAVAAALALLSSGCGFLPEGAKALEACRAACAPGLMERATLHECACAPLEGACSVDRLLVAPVPPGPDGRERRGGRLAKAVAP